MEKKILIKLENIHKKYKNQHDSTIDNISLTIKEAEIFSLLGPSGCGKTTLLRMIAGFEKPDHGKIFLNGEDITDMPAYKRPINMMFQNYALFPHLTIEDNIAFGLRQEKLSDREINKRVKQALEMVALEKLSKRYPSQISGGQQQRTALARSIVKRPKLLLLDEPLGSLDRNTKERTQMELIKIQNYLNITFIIVTHDQEEAMSLSDQIAVLKDGKVLQIGSPEEIYERPKSKFVANFVGSTNFFKAIIKSHKSAKILFNIENQKGIFLIKNDYNFPEGKQVWFAIRPEELTITDHNREKNSNTIKGKIIDIAFLGSQLIYHVQLQDGNIIHVSIPTATGSKNINLSINSEAYISWHSNDGVFLEK